MVRQRNHAEIVFADLHKKDDTDEMKKKERQLCSVKSLIFNGTGFAAILISAILFNILFLDEDKAEMIIYDWTESVGD